MARQFRSDDTDKWKDGFGNGSAGNLTAGASCNFRVTDATIGNSGNTFAAITGTSGNSTASTTDKWGFTTTYTSAGEIVLIHQTRGTGAGNWELNVVTGGIPASGSGTITLKYPLQNTYTTGAQIVRAAHLNSLTINSGVVVSQTNWDGSWGGIIFIVAKTSVTINGTLNVSQAGFRNNGAGGNQNASQGEGTSGAGGVSPAANGNGGGGGGDYQNGTGSGGGNGAAGTAGFNSTAGAAAGNAGLTTMVFGGQGGGASSGGGDPTVGGAGGAGGGIVVIISPTITIHATTGSITSAAGNGGVGDANGGGGGAGGSVLLKGQVITIGTSRISVAAGAGGDGSNRDGGNGGVGRIHADYKTSFSGSTSPTIDTRQDSTIAPIPKGAYFHMSV